MSLSARRAWIEILYAIVGKKSSIVALRKESVDRNLANLVAGYGSITSLSARRAWIEIWHRSSNGRTMGVALRKESVDRNMLYLTHKSR